MFFKKYFLLSILIDKDISNRAFLYYEQKHNQRNSFLIIILSEDFNDENMRRIM